MTLELFHAVPDADSAAARREVTALALLDRIQFRNIFYPEVDADFRARGGTRLPALWDGTRLTEGLEPVLVALRALASTNARAR